MPSHNTLPNESGDILETLRGTARFDLRSVSARITLEPPHPSESIHLSAKQELHFARAAERVGINQSPLSLCKRGSRGTSAPARRRYSCASPLEGRRGRHR